MKIPFKIAINRIVDKYFGVSVDKESPARVAVSCDEISAFLLLQLTADLTEAQMLEKAIAQFPDTSQDILNEKVLKVREVVRNLDPDNTELEIIEI